MPVTIRPRRPLLDRLAASETRDSVRVTIPSTTRTYVLEAPRGFVVDPVRALDPISILVLCFDLRTADAPLGERRRWVAVMMALAALPAAALTEAAQVLLGEVDPTPHAPQTISAKLSLVAAFLAGSAGMDAARARIGDEPGVWSAKQKADTREGLAALQALAAARRPVMPAGTLTGRRGAPLRAEKGA